MQQVDLTPAPLIDLKQAARVLGMPDACAKTYLKDRHEYPVGSYRGRHLWLSDSVHEAIPTTAEQV